MYFTLYIALKSIIYTLYSVKKCLIDSLSVLFRGLRDLVHPDRERVRDELGDGSPTGGKLPQSFL